MIKSLLLAGLLTAALIAPVAARDQGGCPMLNGGAFLAQVAPDDKGPDVSDDGLPGPPGPGMLFGGKGGRYLEQFRMLKLLELLDLSEDQEASFMSRFRHFRKNLSELDEKKQEHLKALVSCLRTDKTSDKEISDQIRKIQAVEESKRLEMTSFIADVDKLLTPRQIGKLILFQERFEFELLGRIRAFRERGNRGNNQPSGPDSGGEF
jgi:Spy/CpxP family protein refolding chaperone